MLLRRRDTAVLRRLIKASAVVVGAGLAVAGCSVTPVQMGAAAVMTSQRITIANLDTEVTNLSQTVKQYPDTISLTTAQQTQDTLTWLVRFQINEELASQQGITVSAAQAEAALAELYAEAKSEAESEGLTNVTLDFILAYAGLPPNLSAELGRYQAIENQYVKNVSGGKIPTSSAGQTAATTKLEHAQCLAAKSLNIRINPQFGRMDYSQPPYQVVSAPSSVSGTPGPAPTASPSGTAPPC
jgi:hypothetical protein